MADISQDKIRNFCIIAHIDHGKSTLADRIIEQTGLLTSREMQAQVLDNMDLERERGITIKSQAVRTVYRAKDGEEYIFNLIDTPGHVDFNYEVSRSLAACDGAILVVDAAQGIEAQTLANVYLALDHDLDVFPVINKIDLPSADPDRVAEEIEDVIGLEAHDAPRISAKMGLNIDEVLESIVTKIPAPDGDPKAPLSALIFDSLYDSYRGVIVFCRIVEGTVKRGTRIRMFATGASYDVVEVGYFGAGQFIPCEELSAGMVGYLTASIKNVKDTRVGDTITDRDQPCKEPLPGYKKVTPMVYCGMYPADGARYPELRDALEKLQLNDASLFFEPETSVALGFGFRCGFLGLLHLEIVQERLEREYNLDLVTTAPSVIYKVHKTNGEVLDLTNPTNLPDPAEIEQAILEELKMTGMVSDDEEVIRLLDKGFETKSSILPVAKKKDGSFTQASSVLSAEDFETVSNYVNHKIKELGTCVLDGDIRLNPYEQKDQNACTYCVYKSVCGFDRKLGAGLVRRLEELDAQEAIEKMKEDGGK